MTYYDREVIVVGPDKYKPLVRHLTHVMSQFKGCKAASWSIKQYEDNEFQLGGQRYAVFLGDQDENPLTKDYLPLLKMKHSEGGICYAYDGPKAVIFGSGALDQEENFKTIMKTFYEKAAATFRSSLGIAAVAPVWLLTGPAVVIPAYTYLTYSFGKFIFGRYKIKELKHKQIKVAVEMFCKSELEQWLRLNSD